MSGRRGRGRGRGGYSQAYEAPSKSKKDDSDDEAKDEDEEKEVKEGDEEVLKEEDDSPLILSECAAGWVVNEKHADVVFVVGKDKVRMPAHRILLAMSSPVFEWMLFPPAAFPDKKLDEKLPIEIAIPDEDPAVFKAMLQCIYTDQLPIEQDAVRSYIDIALKYEIEKLKQLCTDFVAEEVNEENALDLLTLSTSLGTDNGGIMNFVAENAEKVLESDAFLALAKASVKILLEDSKLCIGEIAVMKAVIRWGKAEAERQKKEKKQWREMIADVIPCIRFPLLTVEELATEVASTGLLDQNVLVMLFAYCAMDDSKKKHMAKTVPFNVKPRLGAAGFKGSDVIEPKLVKTVFKFFDKKKLKTTLLYSGKKDGYNAGAFHGKCDGRGATLTVIRAGAYVFGGYNADSWTQNSDYSQGESWLFNLVNPHKLPPIKLNSNGGSKAYGAPNYGPTWGDGHDLHVSNTMKAANSSYSSPNSFTTVASGYTGAFGAGTLAGQYYFMVDEIEVWGITQA
jgi:hypothetical protein